MTIAAYLGLLGAWVAAITSPGPDTVQLIRLGSRSRRSAILAALGICSGNILWPVVTMAGLAALIAAFPWILAILYIGGGLFLLKMGIGSFRGGLADYRARAVIPIGQHCKRTTHLDHAAGPNHAAGRDSTEGAESTHAGLENIPESARADLESIPAEGMVSEPRDLPGAEPRTLTDFQSWKLGLYTNLSNPKALLFFGAVFAQFLPMDITLLERIIVLVLMTAVGLIWFCGFSWAVSLPIWAEKLQRANPVIEMVAGVNFALLAMFLLYEDAITVAEHIS